MDKTLALRMRQALFAVSALIIIACFYSFIRTVTDVRSTGLVHIDTSISQAVISISQDRHEAEVVGTGTASIRLKPGLYQVRGFVGRSSADELVRVPKNKTTRVSLKLSETQFVRSVDDVDFNGMSRLTDNGLSSDQTTALELDFFRFNTAAQVVIIDGDSFSPGARNSGTSIGFTATFNVSVDSIPYKATVSYSGLSTINLTLSSAKTNSLVFNSDAGAGSAIEGD